MLVRLRATYTLVAVICFNCIILFVAINLVASTALDAQKYLRKRAALKGSSWAYTAFRESMSLVYPNMTKTQITGLITETRRITQGYEAFTQFKENPFKGRYVKVDPRGFRPIKNQKGWPPRKEEFNVFMFGGSTTFGYGVTDDLTIASHLQELLASDYGVKANVYNFGRAHYFSVQERLLFEKLLMAGFVPRLAIFLDGLNDLNRCDGLPAYTKDLEKLMRQGDVPWDRMVMAGLPVVKALSAMFTERRIGPATPQEWFRAASPDRRAIILQGVIDRYRLNKKITEAISKKFDITPVFVWQPVPVYKYDGSYSISGGTDYDSLLPALKPGYISMAKAVAARPLGSNFIWAADMQENMKKPLYVDAVHYSGEMSMILAKYILAAISEQGLVPRLHRVKPSSHLGSGVTAN
jgi:hypothetical protein